MSRKFGEIIDIQFDKKSIIKSVVTNVTSFIFEEISLVSNFGWRNLKPDMNF